jgi:uncharacterized protein YecT (DUF1311 family)
MTLLRATAAALAVALLASANPASADDKETIAACLKEARKSDRDAHICLGRVADPCMETPEGQSTVGMVMCTDKETKLWDAMLNEEYGRLLPLLKAEGAEDVRKAQRIWITSRDADCRVPYHFFDGGTITQPIGAHCLLDHTADRALMIRSWREMAQGE